MSQQSMHAMINAPPNALLIVAILSFQISAYLSSFLAGMERNPYLYLVRQQEVHNTERHASYIEYLLWIKALVGSIVSISDLVTLHDHTDTILRYYMRNTKLLSPQSSIWNLTMFMTWNICFLTMKQNFKSTGKIHYQCPLPLNLDQGNPEESVSNQHNQHSVVCAQDQVLVSLHLDNWL